MSQLSETVRGSLRMFAFILGNGTLYAETNGDLGDYRPDLIDFGSTLEMVFAIYTNVLDIGPDGRITNEGAATRRAAQYIRHYVDPTYTVEPPFQDWETELH